MKNFSLFLSGFLLPFACFKSRHLFFNHFGSDNMWNNWMDGPKLPVCMCVRASGSRGNRWCWCGRSPIISTKRDVGKIGLSITITFMQQKHLIWAAADVWGFFSNKVFGFIVAELILLLEHWRLKVVPRHPAYWAGWWLRDPCSIGKVRRQQDLCWN